MGRKTIIVVSLALLICLPTVAFGFENVLCSLSRRVFGAGISSEGTWSVNEIMQWSESARSADGFVELVIGIKAPRVDSCPELARLAGENGGSIVNKIANEEMTVVCVVRMPVDAISRFVNAVEASGLADYIEPNIVGELESVPNDFYWGQQWGLKMIGADWAWNSTVGDDSILVAILDSGMNFTHPDLAWNYVPLGRNWVNNNTDVMDVQGHGTNVAGIIAAEMNNAVGVAGVAQVRVMMERVTNPLTLDSAVNGIYHAVDEGAKIINMSWGFYSDSALLHDAIKYAYDAGVLLIAAAGNEKPYATPQKPYPAGYDEVIGVSATDESDRYVTDKKGWNYGSWVEVAAPGVNIWTTAMNGGWECFFGGTSFAAACVSGVGALVWSRFPYMTRDQVRVQLRHTADHPAGMGIPGIDIHYGYGRVNARIAVDEAEIPSIQETVDLMERGGGAMVVGDGAHSESVFVNKSVSFFGQTWNGTAIDGGGSGYAIALTGLAQSVKIGSLILQNCSLAAIALNGSNNAIYANNIVGNAVGIWARLSANNMIYHNNFINNSCQVLSLNSTNMWDNGYPSGGNYWSDYHGVDLFSGPHQNISGSDGIGDTPYVIDAVNRDRYPLMQPYQGVHSVAVKNAAQNKTIVGQGLSTWVYVDLANKGDSVETFDVKVEANATSVISDTVTLRSNSSVRVFLRVNTSGWLRGDYVLRVCAAPVVGELDVADNEYSLGSFQVAMVGDLNGPVLNVPDGKVDIRDLALVGRHNGHGAPDGHVPGTAPYVACFNADVAGIPTGVPDNIVDTRDIAFVSSHYGEHD